MFSIHYVVNKCHVRCPRPNTTDCHDITDILLKAALSTIKTKPTNLPDSIVNTDCVTA